MDASRSKLSGLHLIDWGNCLGAATISDNTWIHRFVTIGVRPLARTPITPNHVTTLRLATGLVACIMYCLGGTACLLYGSGLLTLSLLLDRADGILARLTDQRSIFGHRYDLISDVIVNICIFVSLGVGMPASSYSGWAPVMGIVAGVAVGSVFLCVILVEQVGGTGAAGLPSVGGFDADDLLFVVPIGVVFSNAEHLLAVAFVAAPLFSIGFVWWFRRQLFRRQVSTSTLPHKTPETEQRP